MTARIKLRRDTAQNWTGNNPILALGEPGFETDTNKLKIGDGVTAWADLGYTSGGAGGSLSIEKITNRLYDTLQSGTPSWLTSNNRGVWTEGVNWGFDRTGLWFQGDLSDNNNNEGPNPQVSFPVFTNFVVPYGTDVTVGFDFTPEDFNGENWSDHGICAYVDGTDPIWNWQGQTANIVVARFDSQYLDLDGVPDSTTDTIIDGQLVAGTEYRMMFTYNSRSTSCIVEVWKAGEYYSNEGNYSPVIVKGISNNNLLGESDIRIGFAADPDAPDARSYYKNLSIEFADNNEISGLPITLDATFTPEGQLKLPGDMILGDVRDEDYVLWAPKGAEYAGIWWGGDREDNNGNGYGPDGSITVGYDSNDDNAATDNATGVRVALTAKTKSWTFDEKGSLAGPDGTVTVNGNIAVGGTPMGWIVTEGEVPNPYYDLWFDHVLQDDEGNVYALGGNYSNGRRLQFNKYNSSGAVIFQTQIQIIENNDSDFTSAELSNDGSNITAVMRYYDGDSGMWNGGIIVLSTNDGSVISFESVTNQANQDFELLDLDFDSQGNVVYVGKASPNPEQYTVTSTNTLPGSTSNVLYISPAIVNGVPPIEWNWRISGSGFGGEQFISNTADQFNYVPWTSTGALSGFQFAVYSKPTMATYGTTVQGWGFSSGGYAAVGDIITVLGSSLGGRDGGRINKTTTYIPVRWDGSTAFFSQTDYPAMDQDIINSTFVTCESNGARGITTMVFDNGDGNWAFNIDFKIGTAPTSGQVKFYAGNDFTAEVVWARGDWYFGMGNFDGAPQLDYIRLEANNTTDFSTADSAWTIYNYANANALLKTANWEKTYGGTQQQESWEHVVLDSADNVYVATEAPSIDGGRWVITKFNSSGDEQWSKAIFEENTYIYIGGLAIDKNDNLIVAGRDSNYVGVVMKVAGDGSVVWYSRTDMNNFNNWNWNQKLTPVVDDNNNVLISDSIQIYNSDSNTNGYDIVVISVNGNDGSLLWSRFLGTDSDDYNGYDAEGYHITSRGNTYSVVCYYSTYNDNAMLAQLPLDGNGIGQHGAYSYRDANIPLVSVEGVGGNAASLGITDTDVIVSTPVTPFVVGATQIPNTTQLVTTTEGGNVTGVRSLEFDDGTVQTTAAKGPDSSWADPNGGVWTIETYNGGFSGYYDGGNPIVWWDVNNTTNGSNNFRGAIIEYHAFTGDGNIIGTIHVASDYSQYNDVTHTENMSGNQWLNDCNFWYADGWAGQLYFKTESGNSRNISVQWTSRVFRGNESNC